MKITFGQITVEGKDTGEIIDCLAFLESEKERFCGLNILASGNVNRRANNAPTAAPSSASNSDEAGPNEKEYVAKYGPTRLRNTMISRLNLSGNREEMFGQLLDGRDSGAIVKTPTGFEFAEGGSIMPDMSEETIDDVATAQNESVDSADLY